MTNPDPQSAIELDHQDYLDARDSSVQDLLVYAAKTTGRSVLKIQREFRQMANSHSRLNMVEYVRNGLYDIDRFTPEQRAEFISNDLHWPVTHTCNDRSWSATAEDKFIADSLLSAGGIPVPETVAIIDKSARAYPGATKVRTADGLRDVVLGQKNRRLFGKVVGGMVSFGTFRIEDADDTQLKCAGIDAMSYDRFMTDFVGDTPYIVQAELKNHSLFAPYCSALATVRMVNMVTNNGVMCPVAVIKLPQGDNIADAFWRPGNLACALNPESGRIETVARRGIEVEFLDDHPQLPGLMGLELPFWSELRDINKKAAQIYAPIRYQSTDIAITENGPVIVEINYGGGFDLPQYASGRGMLTPEVRAFFEDCGYNFSHAKKRGLRLLRR